MAVEIVYEPWRAAQGWNYTLPAGWRRPLGSARRQPGDGGIKSRPRRDSLGRVDVFEALAQARAAGQPAVLVTVVAVEGEAPSHPGAKLLVVDGAMAAGTLGCAEFDTAGVGLAGSLSESATLRRRVVFGHGQERALEMFAERYDPHPAVLVIGATPVARAVAELARFLHREVVDMADAQPDIALRHRPPGPQDSVIVSDHDAPYVDGVLRLLLRGQAGFVGMVGSRRHAPEVVERLRSSGVPSGQLARLHTPCGLDIGSRTPQEIALSIVAEILAAERGRGGGRMGVDWS
ncbi:MAG: XdhC family protein [Streptomycetales bacterium]